MSEGVTHPVTLSPYFIDRTEVTVADYTRCVSAGRCGAPGFSASDARYAQPSFPVVLVTWEDARDYCTFARGRLPTEAEWELAARGLGGRTFPWGEVYNPHLSNHGSLALDVTDATDGFEGLAPVGSIPDGKTALGVLDMAGNAAEWVADAFDPDQVYEQVPPYPPTPETNPRHDAGSRHIIRGGSYMQGADFQRSAARYGTYPTRRLPYVGFRCASD
jgi:formylglycine-generating enzyme required for sulfatase activity